MTLKYDILVYVSIVALGSYIYGPQMVMVTRPGGLSVWGLNYLPSFFEIGFLTG